MKVLSSIKGIVDPWNANQGLNDVKTAELTNLYFDMEAVCPAEKFELISRGSYKSTVRTKVIEHPESLAEIAGSVYGKAKERNLQISLAKAPTLFWETKQTTYNEKLKALTEESIKCCGKYGVKKLIVAPIFAGIPWDRILGINKEFYSSLITLAREQGVMILLENQCREYGGHLNRGLFSKGREAAEFIDDLNEVAGEELFGFAFNSGNANICAQNAYEELLALGNRVKAVLISDNDGASNSKLLPFTSTGDKGLNTDWLNLIRGVRAIDFDGDVVLEYSHSATAASPFLKPSFLTYAKRVGEYFVWQFEMDRMVRSYGDRVLFGAGNMCRNYMKNYGEKYPPLYTCDNNSANWGKIFEGLEIKNPEELKSLPEDTAIFICNVYYREIETQLKEMGLKNPIVFFNDEYMQSFYFERLEMTTSK